MRAYVAALTGAVTLAGGGAIAQETVLIDGSSTVFPISEAMAEEFQKETRIRVTVGISGTGGGFKKFCRGETHISGASRPIRSDEMELCEENGIEFIEMPIALDALANIVHPDNDWAECLTVGELKRMWAPEAQGTITNWNQIREGFPDRPLVLFGAGVDSGTYDYYTAAIVGTEHSSRGDFTATEDDNITVQGVSRDPNALGFLGLAYVEENLDLLKKVGIQQEDGSCVEPAVETAKNATYQPLSRPIFFYFSKQAADQVDSVRQFAEFSYDPENAGPLVAEVGYVPLPEEITEAALRKFEARKTGTFFEGGSKIGVGIEELVRAE
jgi:phosphate transport system substrate-binding protein